jgi:hypothetical protein
MPPVLCSWLHIRGVAEDLAPDLSPAESAVMEAVQGPLSAVAFASKATQADHESGSVDALIYRSLWLVS